MKGTSRMELRPDRALLAQTPLAMSCASEDELSHHDAEIAGLVRMTLEGNSAAFEQIIIRYETRVMTLAARLMGARDEAQDVAQEVFLRAFRYLHRLDLRKPVEPWLMQITVNVCRNAARQRLRHRRTLIGIGEPEAIDQSENPFAGVARQQERVLLQRALDSLPEKERLAIVLRDVEGLSTAEVASLLRSSEATVRSQVSRGRLRLKAAVNGMTGGKA